MVVRTNLIDMIEVTRSVHYENFRLRQMDKLPKHALDKDPFTQMEEDRRKKENELAEKKRSFEKLDIRERDLKQEIDLRKAELERLKQEIDDLRRGSIGDSKTSLSMTNENSGKSSPTDKIKKKSSTLGLFNRN
ncbi:unnamed protein product [Cylicostephanus goldi]|uniref:Septin-type G domain-containing protein n=1 Tax=Cylicostephanus goldi TaxID=71465 RepID=A0A3P6S342_CYLGO|nr:unnamed protein product [Cylicostephanus goldi]